jgi:hypothetical protein
MKKETKKTVQSENENIEIEVIENDINLSEIAPEEIENEIAEVSTDTANELKNDNVKLSMPEEKADPESEEKLLKLKIKALKRSIDNKKYAIDRDQEKADLWRIQAKERDEKATTEFETKKILLEEQMKKNQERYNKRIQKTSIYWHIYTDDFEINKILKSKDELSKLETELIKLEEQMPVVAN